MIFKFKEFILEKLDIRNDIDLQKEFDDINNRCFNNELPKISLVWVKSKKVGGRTTSKYNPNIKSYQVEKIEISYFFEMDYDRFKNILAHEMVHAYIYEKNIKEYGGSHGIHFKEWMRKLNNMGFNIDIKDDATDLKITDENDLSKTMVVFLEKEEKRDKTFEYGLTLFQENFVTDEIKERILNAFRRTNTYTHKKLYLTFIKSKDARLKRYKIKRSLSTFSVFTITEKFYNELMEQGDIFYDTVLIE
jgi:predicted SprT family Zn-dependent metalloprotease